MIRWLKALLPITVMGLSLVLIFLSICQGGLTSRAPTHSLSTMDRSSEAVIVVDCLLKDGCEQERLIQGRRPTP